MAAQFSQLVDSHCNPSALEVAQRGIACSSHEVLGCIALFQTVGPLIAVQEDVLHQVIYDIGLSDDSEDRAAHLILGSIPLNCERRFRMLPPSSK